MFGIKYIKAGPATYLIQYSSGQVLREGLGLSFFYFAPKTTLVSVPMQTVDAPFMFNEVCSDYQEVTVQGQVTYRVADVKTLVGMMDFTLLRPEVYQSEDPERLPQRVINAVQVQVNAAVQRLPLEKVLRSVGELTSDIRDRLNATEALRALGLAVVDFSLVAIKPNPETARALEARVRETILKEADDAIYSRRNSAIEQERGIKENELKTEIAIEAKKRQIRETQMEAEKAVLEKQQEIERRKMEGRVDLERRNQELVVLATDNARKEAEARAYGIEVLMKALSGVDARTLQALSIGSADPSALIAMAFQDLAGNAQKIGELNISPDLLKQLATRKG